MDLDEDHTIWRALNGRFGKDRWLNSVRPLEQPLLQLRTLAAAPSPVRHYGHQLREYESCNLFLQHYTFRVTALY